MALGYCPACVIVSGLSPITTTVDRGAEVGLGAIAINTSPSPVSKAGAMGANVTAVHEAVPGWTVQGQPVHVSTRTCIFRTPPAAGAA